jgi:ketosteroid isomerase-like protein
MTGVERAILDIEKKQAAAFNQGDLKSVLDFFDQHIVCFSSTQQERVTGRAALRRTFEYYLKEADKVQYRITQPVVQVYGDTAIASFYWTVTLTSGSKRQTIEGRGSHVLVNQKGAWKIVHEHFSRAHHAPEK